MRPRGNWRFAKSDHPSGPVVERRHGGPGIGRATQGTHRRRFGILGRQQRGCATTGAQRPDRLPGVRLPGRAHDVDPGRGPAEETRARLCHRLRLGGHAGSAARHRGQRHTGGQQCRRCQPRGLCRSTRGAGPGAGRGAENRGGQRRRCDAPAARPAYCRRARNAQRCRLAATGADRQRLPRRLADQGGAGRRCAGGDHRALR